MCAWEGGVSRAGSRSRGVEAWAGRHGPGIEILKSLANVVHPPGEEDNPRGVAAGDAASQGDGDATKPTGCGGRVI